MVVIATKEAVSEIDGVLDNFRKKKILCRPVRISDVIYTCNEILGITHVEEKNDITEMYNE